MRYVPFVIFKVNELSVYVGVLKFLQIVFDLAKEVIINRVAGKLIALEQKTDLVVDDDAGSVTTSSAYTFRRRHQSQHHKSTLNNAEQHTKLNIRAAATLLE